MFAVEGVTYDWTDVVLAAALWGNWEALERRVTGGLACRSGASDGGADADADTLRRRAKEFRQRRGLLSADEMQAWLLRWHLTSAAWMDYLRRAQLRDAAEADGAPQPPTTPPPAEEAVIAAAMHAEAVCSGRLEAWAKKLAGRAAVGAEMATRADRPTDASASGEAGDPGASDSATTGRGLPATTPDDRRARSSRLHALEGSFERYRQSVVTPEAIEAEVRAKLVEWVRLDCEYVTVPDDDAAREVAISLRRGERSIEELSGAAGVPLQRRSLRLDAVSPDLGAALVSARPGDVLGPMRSDHGFLVLKVLSKTEPSADEPETREAAGRLVLDRAVQHLVNERVVWLDRF